MLWCNPTEAADHDKLEPMMEREVPPVVVSLTELPVQNRENGRERRRGYVSCIVLLTIRHTMQLYFACSSATLNQAIGPYLFFVSIAS